jgi:hypothetical protein
MLNAERYIGAEFLDYYVDQQPSGSGFIHILVYTTVCRAGLPLKTLEGMADWDLMRDVSDAKQAFLQSQETRSSIRVHLLAPQTYALPIGPIWSGVVVNSTVFAITIWLLFDGLGLLRAAWRRYRGVCTHCAYPISHSPVCTECGKPVKPRPAAPA